MKKDKKMETEKDLFSTKLLTFQMIITKLLRLQFFFLISSSRSRIKNQRKNEGKGINNQRKNKKILHPNPYPVSMCQGIEYIAYVKCI